MKSMNPVIVEFLKDLCEKKKGLLHPRDIVDAARPEISPIHHCFEWDDDKAAEEFRIWQARKLITNVYVLIQNSDGKKKPTQVFVSLSSDRDRKGGYREIEAVLSDKDMRNQLIRDAIDDMQVFTDRYKQLRELARVFSAMRTVSKKLVSTH